MTNTETIYHFYTSLQEGNIHEMLSCYHPDVQFNDPVFGTIHGPRAKYMWRMLVGNESADLHIDIVNVFNQNGRLNCDWTADYKIGKKQRPVHNVINSKFIFKNNLIIGHFDFFDAWRWSRQALGLPGYLLGWTDSMQRKIIQQNNQYLDRYIEKMRSAK